MLSAWYGGLGPALLATGIATLAIAYFFIPTPGVLTDVDAFSRLALFVVAALLTSLVASGWKHANRSLQESELRFRSVAQSASDAVIVADSLGKIVIWNRTAEKMFGYQEAEVLGKPVTLLMPVRYRDAHSKGLERLRTTGESRMIGKTVELQGLRKDGQEFPLELSVAACQSERGAFYSGIIRDITQRRQADEALRNAHTELEARVRERTAELSAANTQLRQEIHAHRRDKEQKDKLVQELGERVKELTVLHRMARLLQDEHQPLETLLREIAAIVPAASPVCPRRIITAVRKAYIRIHHKRIPNSQK
jgi:PAS domain S-box-containing protein